MEIKCSYCDEKFSNTDACICHEVWHKIKDDKNYNKKKAFSYRQVQCCATCMNAQWINERLCCDKMDKNLIEVQPSYVCDLVESYIDPVEKAIEIDTQPWVVSDSGRRFKRNDEDTGTIMEWNDNGITRYTTIYDAKYRAKLVIHPQNYSMHINGIELKCPRYGYITKSIDDYREDDLIHSICNQDNNDNRTATDNIVNNLCNNNIVWAAQYVRTLNNLHKNGCDLPTINCLSRICVEGPLLDDMDPTLKDYKQYSLASWFDNFIAWSSTLCDVNSFLSLGSDGYVSSTPSDRYLNVIPVSDEPLRFEAEVKK